MSTLPLRQRLKNPRVQHLLGLSFLIAASLWRWASTHAGGLHEGWTDFVTGTLYGISIALLLLSVIRRRSAT